MHGLLSQSYYVSHIHLSLCIKYHAWFVVSVLLCQLHTFVIVHKVSCMVCCLSPIMLVIYICHAWFVVSVLLCQSHTFVMHGLLSQSYYVSHIHMSLCNAKSISSVQPQPSQISIHSCHEFPFVLFNDTTECRVNSLLIMKLDLNYSYCVKLD